MTNDILENKLNWLGEELNKLGPGYRTAARAEMIKKLNWTRQALSLRTTGKIEPTYSEGVIMKHIISKFLKIQDK